MGKRIVAKAKQLAGEIGLVDDDYLLKDGAAWFTAGRFSVRIYSDKRGVECWVYPLGRESEPALAQCVAFAEQLPKPEVVSLAAHRDRR